MVEPMLTDLRALLVEKEDCDAGTVQRLRDALSQSAQQYKSLREVTELLKKKLDGATGTAAKKWHLKLGIASFFLGYTRQAGEHLSQAEGPLANFYLGRAQVSQGDLTGAFKAFDKAEKLGYNASQVQLQKANIHRLNGEIADARAVLDKQKDQAGYNAEYHFQIGSCHLAEGERQKAIAAFEAAIKHDPGHTGALFQLGHANDLAGNDDDAIKYYETALRFPPVHVGTLKNLGILYEDQERYDKAAECFRRVLAFDPRDEQARLFCKDTEASLHQSYDPEDEHARSKFSQVLEIPVTDFELSVRSRNCLKKMNIKTLGDLTRVTEQQLLSSKNFGETSLAEIKEMMTAKGLRLGQSLEDGQGSDRPYRPAIQPQNEEQAALLNKPVSELNLSVRARKCMIRLGINSLGELCQRTADELLEAKNFGQTSLAEVREKLTAYGLNLRGD